MAKDDEGRELEPFVRHGTEGERIKVAADEVLNAIAEGRDIDIKDAVIEGGVDIRTIKDRLVWDKNHKLALRGNVTMVDSEIRGDTSFSGATFSRTADFQKATFLGDAFFSDATFRCVASFRHTTFNGNANFTNATFGKAANFEETTFGEDAFFIDAVFGMGIFLRGATFGRHASFQYATFTGYPVFSHAAFGDSVSFHGATLEHLAAFSRARFKENTVRAGLRNDVLCLFVRWVTKGRMKVRKRPVTDFSEFDTTTVMDGSSNPYLKRYIDDEQWIASWRARSRWREALFFFWELTCHCDRSFGLWLFWSLVVAVVFGAVYADYTVPSWLPLPLKHLFISIDPHVVISPDSRAPTPFTPFYFSIVTFTTLGFGDVTPLNLAGEIWLALEVVLGYIMLGGLISIFANKLARRA